MRRVLAMMVVLTMLVLVVAQAEESSSTIPAPTRSPASLPHDTLHADCGKICSAKCWLVKHVPKHYSACLGLCKKHCKYPLSDAIYNCTFACADSMATRFGSDAVKEDYVETCFNKCKKNG